jgi:hypothetical protein
MMPDDRRSSLMSSATPARFTAHGALLLNHCAVNTNFLDMKNSIIFISALSLVAMMLASCGSIFCTRRDGKNRGNESD